MERKKPTDEELAGYLVALLEEGCRRFTLVKEKEELFVPEGYAAEMWEGVDDERFAFEMKIFSIFVAMNALVDRGETLFWAFHREATRLLFDDESKVHFAFMILGNRYSEYWDALSSELHTVALTKAFLRNVGARAPHSGTLYFIPLELLPNLI